MRIVSPIAMLTAMRWFAERRNAESACGPSAGPHDLPLVAAGAVLVIAIVVLGEAAGSLDVVAAVVGTLAAVAWWATPAVMAVRWVRRPW